MAVFNVILKIIGQPQIRVARRQNVVQPGKFSHPAGKTYRCTKLIISTENLACGRIQFNASRDYIIV